MRMRTKRGGRSRLTWAGRSLAAATGVLLAGALIAPAAAAQSNGHGGDKCNPPRGISSDTVDSGAFVGTTFTVANDRKGNAYLNDSRNPGGWVNLDWVPGTPSCVVDSAVGTTEGTSPDVIITLLSRFGVAYRATCDIPATPFTSVNIAAQCGPGFVALPGTPVGSLDELEDRYDHDHGNGRDNGRGNGRG